MNKHTFLLIAGLLLLNINTPTFSMNVFYAIKDYFLPPSIFEAIENHNIDRVREILTDKDFDINQVNKYGATPLFRACFLGDTEITKELLNHKDSNGSNDIDVNKAFYGCTPISVACEDGKIEIVKELLKNPNIDFNKANNEGYTPLHRAISLDRIKTAKELLKCQNINVNSEVPYVGTPLDTACKLYHLESESPYAKKPLDYVCDPRHLELIKLILLKCPDVISARTIEIAQKNSEFRKYVYLACKYYSSKKSGEYFNIPQEDEELCNFAKQLVICGYAKKNTRFSLQPKTKKFRDTTITCENNL